MEKSSVRFICPGNLPELRCLYIAEDRRLTCRLCGQMVSQIRPLAKPAPDSAAEKPSRIVRLKPPEKQAVSTGKVPRCTHHPVTESITHPEPLSHRAQAGTDFVGKSSAGLAPETTTRHWNEDKRLYKAKGTVWHQSDRQQGRIPEKLRNLDMDAPWFKRGYHGWVYGDGLHRTRPQAGVPVLIEVETATFSEKEALVRRAAAILHPLKPATCCGDDACTKARRIREGAVHAVILVAPALC